MDGIEVLRLIRNHPLHKDLPVVVYSARGDSETIDAALQNGARDYLIKSHADFNRVNSCIEQHLQSAERGA